MLIKDLYDNVINAEQAYEMAENAKAAKKEKDKSSVDFKKRIEIAKINSTIFRLSNEGLTKLKCLIDFVDTVDLLVSEGYVVLEQGVAGELATKSKRKDWGSLESDYFLISWEPEKIEILK